MHEYIYMVLEIILLVPSPNNLMSNNLTIEIINIYDEPVSFRV
jgi:hypothetical protein